MYKPIQLSKMGNYKKSSEATTPLSIAQGWRCQLGTANLRKYLLKTASGVGWGLSLARGLRSRFLWLCAWLCTGLRGTPGEKIMNCLCVKKKTCNFATL